jgi:hypothetical protein
MKSATIRNRISEYQQPTLLQVPSVYPLPGECLNSTRGLQYNVLPQSELDFQAA